MALYRDYRPAAFEDVIGQDAAVTALEAGLQAGKIGHALLFSGPHGVGKTTLARLVAQCLSCDQSPTSTPCGDCPSCEAFQSSSHPDLLEMDAASNRGVDDARAIRERLAVAPMLSGATVLIIDEAHMLTREAQNALLKTLEEPPPGVFFLFATTAPDKLLNTIRSRCQQYLLRPPTQLQLKEAIERVAKSENIAYAADALDAICEASAGSYRDGLSLLDQAANAGQGELTADQVRKSSGMPGASTWQNMCQAVADGDSASAMGIISDLSARGFDIKSSLGELERFLRIVLYAQAGNIPEALQVTPQTDQAAQLAAKAIPPTALWAIISGIESAYQTAAFGGSAALALESSLAQAAAIASHSGESGEPPKVVEPPAQEPRGDEAAPAPETSRPKEAEGAAIKESAPPTSKPDGKSQGEESGPPAEQPVREIAGSESEDHSEDPTVTVPVNIEGDDITTDELPGPAVAAAAFPLLKLALRTHHPDRYLDLRTAWARYDDKRLVLQLEAPMDKERIGINLSVLRRMVDGSIRITSRQREEVKKGRPKGAASKVKPSSDRGSLLASMGLTPLEGERRLAQEEAGQDQFGPDA